MYILKIFTSILSVESVHVNNQILLKGVKGESVLVYVRLVCIQNLDIIDLRLTMITGIDLARIGEGR